MTNKLVYAIFGLNILIALYFLLFVGEWFRFFVFLIFAPLMIFLPRFLYKVYFYKFAKREFLEILERLIMIAYCVAVAGTLWFFAHSNVYDKAVHFVVPFVGFLLASMFYGMIRFNHKDDAHFLTTIEIIFVAFATVMIFSVLWEAFEFYGDQLIGSKMFFAPGQTALQDFWYDLFFDSISALLASLLVFFRWDKWVKNWRR